MVKVVLSEAPQRDLAIPLTTTFLGGATEADIHDQRTMVPQSAPMRPSLNSSSRAEEDTIPDHGESVRLSFGTLPPGVTASGTTTTTITIIDDDPAVTVEFDSTTYSVTEGSAVTVTVTLSEDPKRPLTIPITLTEAGHDNRARRTPGPTTPVSAPPSPSPAARRAGP